MEESPCLREVNAAAGNPPPPKVQLEIVSAKVPKRGKWQWPPFITALWQQRHPHLRRRLIWAFGVFALCTISIYGFTHWHDPDRDFKFTNFLVAFFPLAFSVFAAFIPDMEKVEKMRFFWRLIIIASGLGYSLITWHQQTINLASSRHDQEQIVRAAVQSANAHSDEKLRTVREDLGSVRADVATVRSDLRQGTADSDQRIDQLGSTLRSATETFSAQVLKTENSLSKSIGSIALPPDKVGQLQFTFWTDTASLKDPVLTLSLTPDEDDIFEVPYTIGNTSAIGVKLADIWIDICSACTFVEEPKEFDKTEGTSATTRHRTVNINPGANLQKQVIRTKLSSRTYQRFTVGFRYSCDICGSMLDREPQNGLVIIMPKPSEAYQRLPTLSPRAFGSPFLSTRK
jgi:hypothetical protein